MALDIDGKLLKSNIEALLDETIRDVKGIYLDGGTSLTETLSAVSAEEASRSILEGGTTIAGHVDHLRFYLRVLKDYMDGKPTDKIDWSQSWLRKSVTESEWEDLKSNLSEDFQRLQAGIAEIDDWNDEKRLGGALAIIAHTSYHLGAIRQMLKVIKKRG